MLELFQMKKTIFITLCLFLAFNLQSQIVSVTPYFPTVNDDITITYDATKGNAGLVGVTQAYMHTGLITNQSTTGNDWKNIVGNWGKDDPKVKMTYIGNNKHIISFNIKNFYNVAANVTVNQMAFVFRNVDGTKEGKTADLKDIFLNVYQASSGLLSNLASPDVKSQIVNNGDSIRVLLYTSKLCTVSVTDNGQQIKQLANTKELDFQLKATQPGTHKVLIVSTNNFETVKDSFYYTINKPIITESLPQGIEPGITVLSDTSVVFALYAPYKQYAYVIGEFNDWLPDESYFMKRTPDGNTWWLQVDKLKSGVEYAFQYFIDGNLKIGDPYSHKVLDPYNDSFIDEKVYPGLKQYPYGQTTGYVTVFQTDSPEYDWKITDYAKPKNTDLVIYELLVRDFLADHKYQTLYDTLDYLVNLGVNAIELMPVNEFEGNNSWGYNPAYQLALDKYYGPPDELKKFIDLCHSKGIVVLFDMVLNHACGQCPLVQLYFNNKTGEVLPQSPYYNVVAKHPFNVCYDMNHESPASQYFVDRVLKHWINEFHFDGYRFDLSKGITQKYSTNDAQMAAYDASRIKLLERIADVCWSENPEFYVILEHFADNNEEKELASKGMMLWGNINNNFLEASMGYPSDLTQLSYKARGWNQPNLIGYMESHDEERMLYKNLNFGKVNGNYNVKKLETALDRAALSSVFFFTIPGPKMLWMFGELGYDYSINTCEDGTISSVCRLAPKPIRWDYLANVERIRLNKIYSALINLKISEPLFETTDFSTKLSSFQKTVHLNSADMNATVLGNFDTAPANVIPEFQHTGTWYDYFSGDSIAVNSVTAPLNFKAGEYHIYTDKKLDKPNIGWAVATSDVQFSNTFKVYPNPATELINIEINQSSESFLNITLNDLFGNTLFDEDFKNLGSGKFEISIPVTNLKIKAANGIYLLKISNGNNSTIQKLIIFNH